jgi:hypothetical protein
LLCGPFFVLRIEGNDWVSAMERIPLLTVSRS